MIKKKFERYKKQIGFGFRWLWIDLLTFPRNNKYHCHIEVLFREHGILLPIQLHLIVYILQKAELQLEVHYSCLFSDITCENKNIRQWKFHQVAQWAWGRKGFSLHEVILWILFMLKSNLRTGHEGARAVWTSFSFPTASQCKKFKQVLLWHVVLRCPHHLKVQSPLHLHSQSSKKPS